jgi:hypothetical protein
MTSLENAFGFVVPKYRYHTNQSYMVIENKWQIEEEYEPKLAPCNTLKYPISGNKSMGRDIYNDWSLRQNPHDPCNQRNPHTAAHNLYNPRTRGPPMNSCDTRNPEFGPLANGANLPPVPLPFVPPSNIGLKRGGAVQTPMFPYEPPVYGPPCNSMSTCNNSRRIR